MVYAPWPCVATGLHVGPATIREHRAASPERNRRLDGQPNTNIVFLCFKTPGLLERVQSATSCDIAGEILWVAWPPEQGKGG
ncbi:hypothetical protein HPP92_015620 [Vanilla planifolia]|uniref:Uncharacterized protein n=1 Tax=Vanilla planifolia TaxID=51239 RepID=A0A835QK20_VANPL|nr:hypothetical protein HPP92_016279 [Vanilla planifolia]KAG0471074.1 hypothetical protein HPP92_015620 [Vanilla planifolia]